MLYCTRVRRERFGGIFEHSRLKNKVLVSSTVLSHEELKMIVTHPLPRNEELEVVGGDDQRAAYFG